MDKLLLRISDAMISSNDLEKDNREVFEYGLELMLSAIVNAAVFLLLGALIHKLVETAVLLATFSMLQTTGGGYHANTRLRCFGTMLCGWVASMLALHFFPPVAYVFLLLCGLALIFRYAPVVHVNAPVDDEKKDRMKHYVRFEALLVSLIAAILLTTHIQIGCVLAMAVFCSGISACIGSWVSAKREIGKTD